MPGAIAGSWVQLKPLLPESEGWGVWLHSMEAPTAREGGEHWPQGLFGKPSGIQRYFDIQKAGLPYPSSLYPTFREVPSGSFSPYQVILYG